MNFYVFMSLFFHYFHGELLSSGNEIYWFPSRIFQNLLKGNLFLFHNSQGGTLKLNYIYFLLEGLERSICCSRKCGKSFGVHFDKSFNFIFVFLVFPLISWRTLVFIGIFWELVKTEFGNIDTREVTMKVLSRVFFTFDVLTMTGWAFLYTHFFTYKCM